MAKLLRILLPCALGIAAALLVSCGDTSGLIPATDASQINQNIDAAQQNASAGNCARASSAVDRALAHVNQLPSSVDPRLKARLVQGLQRLQATAATECLQNKTQATTDTTTSDTTTADTTTQATTDTTPTDTTPTDTGGGTGGGTGTTGAGGGTAAP